jgi:hypothetical protein
MIFEHDLYENEFFSMEIQAPILLCSWFTIKFKICFSATQSLCNLTRLCLLIDICRFHIFRNFRIEEFMKWCSIDSFVPKLLIQFF